MLVTIDEHAAPIGRPMLPLFLENDPCLYFLTHENSRKVSHIEARSHVGLTMISKSCYLVVTGTAATSRDQALIQRLWQPTYRAWFPDGKDDREATAIRVSVNRVDHKPVIVFIGVSTVRRVTTALTACATRITRLRGGSQ